MLNIIFRQKLSASTLIETVVASIIFMLVFVIAMDTLTRLLVFNNGDVDYIVIENDIKKCRKQLSLNELQQGEHIYVYEWGEISVGIVNYKENIYQVDMIATSNKKHRRISYRFLQANH